MAEYRGPGPRAGTPSRISPPPGTHLGPGGQRALFWNPCSFFGHPRRPPWLPGTASSRQDGPRALQAAQEAPKGPQRHSERPSKRAPRGQNQRFSVCFSMFFAFSPCRASDTPRLPRKPRTSPQDGPRGPQEAPKTAEEGPKTAQEAAKTAQEGPKTAPRGAKERDHKPKIQAVRPERPPESPKRPPRGPKRPPRRPKKAPRGPEKAQERPQEGPKQPPRGFKTASQRPPRGEPRDQNQHTLGLWAALGHLGRSEARHDELARDHRKYGDKKRVRNEAVESRDGLQACGEHQAMAFYSNRPCIRQWDSGIL